MHIYKRGRVYWVEYEAGGSGIGAGISSPPLQTAVNPLENRARFSRASKGLAPGFSPTATRNHPESNSNSIFQRLFLNWGENISRYFLSCSRVPNAIMLSFPMPVPPWWFLASGIIPHPASGTGFRLFHFRKRIAPNKIRHLTRFWGQNWGVD